MKVALCLSGQPRSFRLGYDYINKNLLSKYDCDVFIHTWSYDFFDYRELINLYKPKSIKIDAPLNSSSYRKGYRFCPYNVVSSLYGIYETVLLAENYINNQIYTIDDVVYDWVIRTRFDFALNVDLDIDNKDNNLIYVPESGSHHVCNDQFVLSSFENVLKYSKAYKTLDRYNVGTFCGEELISGNLRYHNLWDNVKFLDMNPPFPPGKFDGMPNSLIRDDLTEWESVDA